MRTFTLSEQLEERLAGAVQQTGKSEDFIINDAILSYIEDLEDTIEVNKILTDMHSGKEKITSYSDVRKECGLEN